MPTVVGHFRRSILLNPFGFWRDFLIFLGCYLVQAIGLDGVRGSDFVEYPLIFLISIFQVFDEPAVILKLLLQRPSPIFRGGKALARGSLLTR